MRSRIGTADRSYPRQATLVHCKHRIAGRILDSFPVGELDDGVGQRDVVQFLGRLVAVLVGPVEELERAPRRLELTGTLCIRMKVAAVARLLHPDHAKSEKSLDRGLPANHIKD